MLCAALLLVTLPGRAADENPLDQLRDRSAETRWKSLRDRLADRRADRKDRKHDKDTEEGNPALGEAETHAGESESPTVSYPLPQTTQPDWQQAPVAARPLPAPAPRPTSSHAIASPIPAPVPRPAPAAVATKPMASEPVYQELFQLEELTATSETKEAQKPANGPFSAGPEAAPHPGSMTAGAVRELYSTPETPSLVISHPTQLSVPSSKKPGLLPRMPLPPAPTGGEFRTAQNDPVPPLGGSRLDSELPMRKPEPLLNFDPDRNSIDDYLYSEKDYIKPVNQIAPFADYEPDPDVRESDPYRNLCPHPEGDSEEFLCPDIAELPRSDVKPSRHFAHLDYPWVASNVCHYPLYFEDVSTERYGHFHRPLVQPFVSVGRFGVQFLGLPYQMAMHQPAEPTYPLGYFRPGDVGAPKLYYQVPLNFKAAVTAVGVYTGWFFVIP